MGSTVTPLSHLPHLQSRSREASNGELIAGIAAGDFSCLGLLFDRYATDVGRFIARLGVREGDVDDLVQGTFLLVPRAAASFRGGDARAWLLGLAVNLVRRHRRSLARMTARLATWARERTADPPETPSQAFEVREGAARAEYALAALSRKKREAFVLIVMEGVGAEQAAAALGVPVGTVWTRLHHARRELRARLEGTDE
jgi:RNA polymerase sigma factor (sigma-70 family)